MSFVKKGHPAYTLVLQHLIENHGYEDTDALRFESDVLHDLSTQYKYAVIRDCDSHLGLVFFNASVTEVLGIRWSLNELLPEVATADATAV